MVDFGKNVSQDVYNCQDLKQKELHVDFVIFVAITISELVCANNSALIRLYIICIILLYISMRNLYKSRMF